MSGVEKNNDLLNAFQGENANNYKAFVGDPEEMFIIINKVTSAAHNGMYLPFLENKKKNGKN